MNIVDKVTGVGDLRPELLDISQIRVDIYQRGFNRSRAVKMSKKLNKVAFGCPVVGRRKCGEEYVVDGRHRFEAKRFEAEEIGVSVPKIWCMVFDSKGRKEEAKIFLILNGDRFAVVAVDRYKASLVAKDRKTMEIEAILKVFGFGVAGNVAWSGDVRNLSCPQTLYKLHRHKVLQDTLGVIFEAFDKERDLDRRTKILNSGMIGGIGYIFHRVSDIRKGRLIDCLESINIKTWHVEAGGLSGSRSPRYAKYLIEKFYNKNLHDKNKVDTRSWVKL